MRKVITLAVLVAFFGLLAVQGNQTRASHDPTPPVPVGVDGVIGPEWTGVTPTFVPYSGFTGDSRDGHLVAFNVYGRVDADFFYAAFEAVPAPGDQWDDAVELGLGTSANVYLDTDVDGDSDIVHQPLDSGQGGDYCALDQNGDVTNCAVVGNPALGPHFWSVGMEGLKHTDPGGPKGGVREIAVPWDTLQTDPDSLGFALTTCSVNLRTVQAFGYNFSGSQFPNRFGTFSQPGCGPPPSTPGKVSGGGKIEGSGDNGILDIVTELATLLIQGGSGNASVGHSASFGFSVACCPPKGNLQYNDHDAGVQIKATSIASLVIGAGTCGPNTHATFTGTATVNGAPESLEVEVDDCDEPGTADTFSIETDTYSASGVLISGNIQIQS